MVATRKKLVKNDVWIMLMVFMQNIKKAVDVQTAVLLMLNVQESLELNVKE